MDAVELLQIEPTTRCNFTCGFCAGRHMPQADLAFERFVAAIDAFPELRHVELQGEGEPLLHPRFLDMMAVARERGIKVSFITNGSLLSDRTIERILELAPEKIVVSMESADEALFQEIRGGKLSKVVRGLEALMTARRARGLDRPAVGLAVTVMKRTLDALPAIRALYERLGLDGGISVQPLQVMPAYERHYSDEMRAGALSPQETQALMRATRAGFVAPSPVDGFFDTLLAGFVPFERRCPWLERGLYASFDGTVTACCSVKEAGHALGRLGETSSAEILANRAVMRDELAAGRVPAACAGCTIARFAVMAPPS